jgi:hypothetical protein
MISVAICVPAGDEVSIDFAVSLSELRVDLTSHNIAHSLHVCKGSILPALRHDLVLQAQQANASHIMWLDSDMKFPSNVCRTLLVHDVDIVAAAYMTRDGRELPTAFRANGEYGERIFPVGTELMDVDGCGMGMMLTKTQVFAQLPQPWFNFTWDPDYGYYNGEDIYFCQKAADIDIVTYIDPVVSKQVHHIGAKAYGFV